MADKTQRKFKIITNFLDKNNIFYYVSHPKEYFEGALIHEDDSKISSIYVYKSGMEEIYLDDPSLRISDHQMSYYNQEKYNCVNYLNVFEMSMKEILNKIMEFNPLQETEDVMFFDIQRPFTDSLHLINCEFNGIEIGDKITYIEKIWEGYHHPEYKGERTTTAKVLKRTVGAKTRAVSYGLEILSSKGYKPFEIGKKIRKTERVLFNLDCMREKRI